MKIIKCESGKLINVDHIISVEQIHQQGMNKYAVAARTVLDDLITVCRHDTAEEAQSVMNVLYSFLGHPDWAQINMEMVKVKKEIGDKDEE